MIRQMGDAVYRVTTAELAEFFSDRGAKIDNCPSCGAVQNFTTASVTGDDTFVEVENLSDIDWFIGRMWSTPYPIVCDNCGFAVTFYLGPFLKWFQKKHG